MREPKYMEKPLYTCSEYREEMILLALRRRLEKGQLNEEETLRLLKEIKELEKQMGMN